MTWVLLLWLTPKADPFVVSASPTHAMCVKAGKQTHKVFRCIHMREDKR